MVEAIIIAAILIFINQLLFWVESMMCSIVDILYETFEVFAGIKTVMYQGSPNLLIDVFFENKIVSVLYWGMACIGIALTFGFAIMSVIKKMFDSTGEKVKASYGMILTNVFKSILLILLLTAIVSATITATSVLLQQVDYLFDEANNLADPEEIVFTDNQRATMYRILSVIGNYSLNPSFNNRYSINSCFNEIQNDLNLLADERVFNYTYNTEPLSWQYSLKQIYLAANTDTNVYLDVYNEELTDAILACAERIKTNASFKPLESYKREDADGSRYTTLGRTIMISGTMRAAKNTRYNRAGSVDDALRSQFYYGDKDAYSYDEITDYFDIKLSCWDHIVILAAAYITIKELVKILINAVARIFNIILLYVTAPGFIAVMPLDDGGKFKQWTTAFVIQSLSILGSFISVRLMIVFIPIIMDGNLVLFSGTFQNILAKIVMVVGVIFTAEKATGMISGILADNAGMQSIQAGDVGSGLAEKGMSIATGLAKKGAQLGFKAASGALSGISDVTGLSAKMDPVKDKLKHAGQCIREKGLYGAIKSDWSTKDDDKKKQEQISNKADQEEKEEQQEDKLQNLGAQSPVAPGAPQQPVPGGEQQQPAPDQNQGNAQMPPITQ